MISSRFDWTDYPGDAEDTDKARPPARRVVALARMKTQR